MHRTGVTTMDQEQFRRIQSRRSFFRDCAGGIGTIALAQMLERDGRAAAVEQNPLAPRKPHFPAKAKNIIFMFMEGGPSQIDLFDPSLNSKNGTASRCPPNSLRTSASPSPSQMPPCSAVRASSRRTDRAAPSSPTS